ncbi:MAG: hypothetical protein HWD61_13995 [Parachlamydiaceae bacterium]|nr:MAG: hypothetical protein HWD61_13995 [Parachlamydiaceae bacterium]
MEKNSQLDRSFSSKIHQEFDGQTFTHEIIIYDDPKEAVDYKDLEKDESEEDDSGVNKVEPIIKNMRSKNF